MIFAPNKNIAKKCIINGETLDYDVCSSASLEKAEKKYHKKYDYIGTGFLYSLNGAPFHIKRKTHFFIKK